MTLLFLPKCSCLLSIGVIFFKLCSLKRFLFCPLSQRGWHSYWHRACVVTHSALPSLWPACVASVSASIRELARLICRSVTPSPGPKVCLSAHSSGALGLSSLRHFFGLCFSFLLHTLQYFSSTTDCTDYTCDGSAI